MADSAAHAVGGRFLLDACGARPIFIPENLDENQLALAEMTREFSRRETFAVTERIEAKEAGLLPELIRKAGGLGLLMAEIPEAHGGLGLSKVTSTVIAENMTCQGSFSVAFTCHTGIGTLPLLYYGTEEQKAKYLPKLATGEMIGAYALTESESGSDALAARTRAVLSPDKKNYILNGEKMYCTNGGIADIITVFAKVDGDKFTAFIVKRGTPGFSTGKEEEKMGLHGTSTVTLILNDAVVPVEDVLGQVGRGHKIAFNTLNIGRFKLGAACVGSSKRMIEAIAPQANQRHQFGKPIGSFELIRQKIARIACRTWLLESLVYRYAGDLDASLDALDKKAADYFDRVHDAIEELSVEGAIAKVYGSEALSFTSDESVQIFGGSGFIGGYVVEQEYRDCRVNRIFEGTNEICRLIIPGTLIKRALKGRIPMMERLGEVLGGMKSGFEASKRPAPFGALVDQVEGLKRLVIYVTGVAVQKLGEGIKERQAVAEVIADLAIESYAFDSGVARAIAVMEGEEAEKALRCAAICEAGLSERVPQLIARARQALINIAGGDEKEFTPYLKGLSRLIQPIAADTDKIYDSIASRILEHEGYDL
ncbi:MAG: acyl-CoA dehydrogenase family protein [Pseudomonadota bacterium]